MAQFALAAMADAQKLPLDSLLRAHSHVLEARDGRLTGAGAAFLMEAVRGTQFIALAEPNVRQVPELSALLFAALSSVMATSIWRSSPVR